MQDDLSSILMDDSDVKKISDAYSAGLIDANSKIVQDMADKISVMLEGLKAENPTKKTQTDQQTYLDSLTKQINAGTFVSTDDKAEIARIQNVMDYASGKKVFEEDNNKIPSGPMAITVDANVTVDTTKSAPDEANQWVQTFIKVIKTNMAGDQIWKNLFLRDSADIIKTD
jgi:hypothetical protein